MRRGIILALGLMALTAFAAVGFARGIQFQARYESKVTLRDPAPAPAPKRGTLEYKGRVTAEHRQCTHTLVTLYRKVPDQPETQLEVTGTDDGGKWNLYYGPPNPPGKYYARVDKRVIGQPGHARLCLADKSNVYIDTD